MKITVYNLKTVFNGVIRKLCNIKSNTRMFIKSKTNDQIRLVLQQSRKFPTSSTICLDPLGHHNICSICANFIQKHQNPWFNYGNFKQ